jgi:hypothetical protein
MERVAYTLATQLGLPITDTHLEFFDGKPSSVQLHVNGEIRTWRTARGAAMMVGNVTNAHLWPLVVVFDIWLANTDRNDGNLIVATQPHGSMPGKCTGSVSWLIDHGQAGLWPGWKLSADNNDTNIIADNPSAVAAGRCHDDVEKYIRHIMFGELERAFVTASSADRQAALDAVRSVNDADIHAAVTEVPADYFTPAQAAALVAFLQGRRKVVDNVVATFW